MIKEKQIEVITYEQDRLNFFTDLMQKAQKEYKRLFKKFKDAPYLSEEAQILSDAGRVTHFCGDVVEMLEKGYRKHSEGEWKPSDIPQEKYVCSVCGGACWYYDYQGDVAKSRYCPNCGAKMKGGAE